MNAVLAELFDKTNVAKNNNRCTKISLLRPVYIWTVVAQPLHLIVVVLNTLQQHPIIACSCYKGSRLKEEIVPLLVLHLW